MAKALEGILVLDNSLYEVGPRTTMLLADMGATVVKLEPPQGEFFRSYAKFFPTAERQVSISNRNKKGMRLDLRKEKGKEIFLELVRKADIFVEAFRPGVAKELGMDYETLSELNPRLIYLSVAIYGQTGPYHQVRGYDIIARATGGMLAYYDPPPRTQFLPISDLTSPVYAAFAIMLALHHRENTGRGQHIDLSCQDVMYATNFLAMSYVCLKDHVNSSTLNSIAGVYPHGQYPRVLYGFYQTKDEDWVFISPLKDDHWRRLVDVIGSDALRNADKYGSLRLRVANTDEGAQVIGEWVARRTREEVKSTMDQAGVPCQPVVRPEELKDDAQLNAREMLVEVECGDLGRYKIPGLPLKLSDTPGTIECPGPRLGEHTEEILATLLGYSEEKIAALKQEGVL
jgi:CoA:oxalate CoA-transferase